MKKSVIAVSVGAFIASQAAFAAPKDFGESVEQLLKAQSVKLFGVVNPIDESSSENIAREPGQTAGDLLEVAHGLKAEIVTREAGQDADMFSFWPSEANPTHLVFCIEEGRGILTDGNGNPLTLPGTGNIPKYTPQVQTIDMETGEVRTILRGMTRCDGIRTTAWGTVLATEETATGGAYEIINPLGFENHTVVTRGSNAAGAIVDVDGNDSSTVVYRGALPTMAWEGLTVLDSGVVIGGDELRPGDWDLAGDGGDDPDVDGGAIFKFVPSNPHAGGTISNLSESPLVNGSVYAFRASCREGTSGSFNVNYGQGCEIGNGSWISVSATDARRDANNNGATGYYRPEDLHKDPTYTGEGVRFCWTNTGREAAQNYGEVLCGIDSAPLVADETQATVVVNRFIEGDTELNSVDNLAFQPNTGNVYIIEDHSNGDIWACLPDGNDRDIKSDGCVRVVTIKDRSAEPTGFEFTADGKTAYMAIQHSGDSNMPLVDDFRTDDIIKITGWK